MNKRIISGVAALALVFSSAVPAFAAENEEYDTVGNFSTDGGDFNFNFDGFGDDDFEENEVGSAEGGSGIGVTTGETNITYVEEETAPATGTTEETPTVTIPEEDTPKAEPAETNTNTNTNNNNFGFGWGNFGNSNGNYTKWGDYLPYTPTYDKEDADKIIVNYGKDMDDGDQIIEIVTKGSEEEDAIFGAKEDWDSPNKEVKFVSASPFTPWVKIPVTVPSDGDKPDYVSYGYYNDPVTDENGKLVPTFNWGWGWFGNYWLNNMPIATYTASNYNNWFSGVPSNKGVEYYTPKDGDTAPAFAPVWFAPKKFWYVPTANWFAPQNYWFGFANWKAPKKVNVKKVKKVKKFAPAPAPVVKVVEKTVYVPVYTPVTNWYNTAFKPVIVGKKFAPKFNFTFTKNFAAPKFAALTKFYKGFIPKPHL
jgi:hypothetical protein